MNTKTITFQGTEFTVPDWVCYVAQDEDGVIHGFQYEPFEYPGSYWIDYGMWCTIYSPQWTKILRRV